MKVLIINHREPIAPEVATQINASVQLYQKEPENFDLDEALSKHQAVEVLVATYHDLTAERLSALTKLKAIVLTTTAYEYVDLAYCREHGIKVFNNSGYSQTAVAEHLLALLMAAARRIPLLDKNLRQGDFNQFDQPGFEFYGKTLGVIGMGHIGQTFAHLCTGFGMNLIYYNRSVKALPYQQVSLETLAQQADAIAVSIPLTDQTYKLLNETFFAQLKPGAILASIAADEVLDKNAFHQAVVDGVIHGAGLDLHEPWPEMQAFPQIVMTPVKGWYTRECMQRRTSTWIKTLNAYLAGEDIRGIV